MQNPGKPERCRRCGKRLFGDITLDGVAVAGAVALAPRRNPTADGTTQSGTAQLPRLPVSRRMAAMSGQETAAMNTTGDSQPSLFPGEFAPKIIPFVPIQRSPESPSAQIADPSPGPSARRPNPNRQTARKRADRTSDTQGSLDFLPPAPPTPRTLRSTEDAQIFCDAPVAAVMHRSVAAFLDAAMVSIGFGMFLAIFQVWGGGARLDKFNLAMLAASLLLIVLFYGFVFALSGRETAGQDWTDLRLINFDGFPVDPMSRFLRFLGCWLSFCACGIGLLWCLLDEENLAWHDHMSKTFPTLREGNSSFFRERLR